MNNQRLCRLCLFTGLLLATPRALAQSTDILSVNAQAVKGNQNSSLPCINADGRYIAFVSTAGNLIPLDTNSLDDIYLRDRQTGAISRISVSSNGVQASGASTHPTMSADGRYIAFQSAATNLVAGKGQGIYLRDTQTSQTTYIAAGSNPVISADGEFIAFVTASALLPADTNGLSDVYIAERATGVISLVSVATDGSPGTGDSGLGGVALSADGYTVAFQSVALNFGVNNTNAAGDIFVRDRRANTTERVSLAFDGSQAEKGCTAPAISADGRLVAFESTSTNLVANDQNDSFDVFLRDLGAQTTTRVSLTSTGEEVALDSKHAVMSADGFSIAFETDAANVVTGDGNGMLDIFVRDTLNGTTTLVSVTSTGAEIDGASYDTALSGDARYVAFTSEGSNVVPGQTVGVNHVFVRGPLVETPGNLSFITQPSGASAGTAFTSQPVVEALNTDGTRKWDFADPVTLVIKAGTGRSGAVLSGTATVNAVNGVATFSGLSIDKADTGYVLTAGSGTLTEADSDPFDVAQTPTQVAVTRQPGGAAAGVAFTTQPTIEIRDAEDNLVASYTGTVTAAVKPGTGTAGATLAGTLSIPIVGGIAAFTDLSLDKAGTGYVLVLSADALTPAETLPLDVAQTPTKVSFSVQPAGASAGIAFTTQPVVQVLDAENNVVTSFNGAVTLAIKAGTGRSGAVLSGTATVNAVNGVATFSGLSIDKAGTGYVLTAGSGALTEAESIPFDVAQTPTKVAYSVQPAGASIGSAFTTQPVVHVLDAENNVVTSYTGAVSLAIKTGTGAPGATLIGSTTVNATAGVASFTGLAIDRKGEGYLLTATSGSFPAVDSSPFTVSQPPFVISDVSKALRWVAGVAVPTSAEVWNFDVMQVATSNGVIDIFDPARIVRKIGGFESNP